jgi:hypothetical protein
MLKNLLAAFVFLVAVGSAYAGEPPTPEMRLAAEVARLNLILAHMGEQVDKQAQAQLKAKGNPESNDKPQ